MKKLNVCDIVQAVKENLAKLNQCQYPPHDFQPIDGSKIFSDYRCTKCGGKVSGTQYFWYRRGLEHGQLLEKEVKQ